MEKKSEVELALMTLLKKQTKFPKSLWFFFYKSKIKAYLRITKVVSPFHTYDEAIVIASVEVCDPADYRKGLFTKLYEELEAVAKASGRCIQIENVLNPILWDFAIKRGYTEGQITGCLYKSAHDIKNNIKC